MIILMQDSYEAGNTISIIEKIVVMIILFCIMFPFCYIKRTYDL